MTKITPQILDQAFLGIDTPMFSEIMKQIEDDERLSATRRRDFLSGLRNVAKALNRQPASVPADGRWLQPRLAKIEPVALGVSQKTWSNTLSNARAAMAHCGILERRKKTSQDLDPNWRPLWKIALAADGPTQQPALGRFVYFLNMQGIAPEKVSDVHASAYLEALKINEISKSPDVAYRAAVNGWNLATRRLPEWPQQQLTLPSRRKRIALPLEDYPESFQADLEAFLYALAHPDPLAERPTATRGARRPSRNTTTD